MGFDWETLEGRYRIQLHKSVMTRTLPTWEDKKVLDIGARVGYWTQWFIEQGADVTSVDIDQQDLAVCQQENPGAHCILDDATKLNLSQRFDLIFCKDVIEHVNDDRKLLVNLRRHSQENGLLVLGTHNQWSLTNLLDGTYNLFFGDVWRGYDPTHVHLYNPYKLTKMLKEAGFQPMSFYGTYHWPYRNINMKLVKHYAESRIWHGIDILKLNGVFPFNYTGWQMIIVARAV